jgi:hypothetical protein
MRRSTFGASMEKRPSCRDVALPLIPLPLIPQDRAFNWALLSAKS